MSNNKTKEEQEEIEKRLKSIQEKLYFCSRCGICKEICPSFNVILSESFSARGRIVSISNEVFDKRLFYNCSLCGACEEICPSDIDLVDIFREIREILVIKKDEINENKKMIKNFKKNDVPFDIDKKEQDDFYCC